MGRGKAKANQRKHGVSFETATEVFDDPNAIAIDNDFTEGEQREQIIGVTRGIVRSEPDIEIIRIISARKAIAYESKVYAAQSRNH
jgi:hypothetical protein